MTSTLNVLSAGATQGLVKSLQERYTKETGAVVQATFGAVGAMKERLLDGAPCDVMIVSESVTDQLVTAGYLDEVTCAPVGKVHTGIGVRSDETVPDVSTPERLADTLLAANGIYVADPLRATGGIHFARVLHQLGLYEQLEDRLQVFPNGATLMRELASSTAPGLLGCAQVTEVIYTPGTTLAGPLPGRFELATTYTATISRLASEGDLASRFIALLTGPDTASVRAEAGFAQV
jgi:molybdate transport system substrate-binding protein